MFQYFVNLISVSQMKRIDNIILDIMTDELFNKTIKKVKTLIKKVNNFFEMKIEYEIFAALSILQASSEIWHQQMRHISYDNLRKLIKVTDEIVLFDTQELFNLKTFKKFECDSCSHIFVKHKFFDKALQIIQKDKLIHVNLIYSIKSISYNKFKNYMFITDDYDRIISVHFDITSAIALEALKVSYNCCWH